MECFTYVLRCSDGTLYTGWTNNLDERIKSHNRGAGSKYTRARLPVTLVYSEVCADKSSAMKREYEIKKMSRTKKEALISALPNRLEQ